MIYLILENIKIRDLKFCQLLVEKLRYSDPFEAVTGGEWLCVADTYKLSPLSLSLSVPISVRLCLCLSLSLFRASMTAKMQSEQKYLSIWYIWVSLCLRK